MTLELWAVAGGNQGRRHARQKDGGTAGREAQVVKAGWCVWGQSLHRSQIQTCPTCFCSVSFKDGTGLFHKYKQASKIMFFFISENLTNVFFF